MIKISIIVNIVANEHSLFTSIRFFFINYVNVFALNQVLNAFENLGI